MNAAPSLGAPAGAQQKMVHQTGEVLKILISMQAYQVLDSKLRITKRINSNMWLALAVVAFVLLWDVRGRLDFFVLAPRLALLGLFARAMWRENEEKKRNAQNAPPPPGPAVYVSGGVEGGLPSGQEID